MKQTFPKEEHIIFSIILLIIILISGCIDDNNDNERVHFIYVMYSKPMEVNTTIYVNNELTINLTNKTFMNNPPVSDIIKLKNANEYNIEVHEKNLNLSLKKIIKMNGNSYISVFITKEKISIKILKDKPEFETIIF